MIFSIDFGPNRFLCGGGFLSKILESMDLDPPVRPKGVAWRFLDASKPVKRSTGCGDRSMLTHDHGDDFT